VDPITAAIVAALSAGAAAAGKEVVTQATKEAYGALKSWIKSHYSNVSVDQLEQQPSSKARQDVVAEDLDRTGATKDTELITLAKTLTDQLRSQAPQLQSIGVDLGQLNQADVTFGNVLASKGATGVKIDTVTGGKLHFGDVTATSESEAPKKA
jgi:hypothetical protein